MICSNCGSEVADGSTFCTNCGAKLEVVTPTAGEVTQGQQVQANQELVDIELPRDIKFTPDEQATLIKGCKTVAGWYLGFAITLSVLDFLFLIALIAILVDEGFASAIMSVFVVIDFAVVLIVYYIKAAAFKKHADNIAVNNTGIFINKLSTFSMIPGIVLSILFFIPGLVPVILTEHMIAGPLRLMLEDLHKTRIQF